MSSNKDILLIFSFILDCENVPCATWAIIVCIEELGIFCLWVISHHEVALLPLVSVLVDVSADKVLKICFDVNPKETFFSVWNFKAGVLDLFNVLWCPFFISVGPSSVVGLPSPRISDPEKSIDHLACCICDFPGLQHRVSMTASYAYWWLSPMISTILSSACDNVTILFGHSDSFPRFIYWDFVIMIKGLWGWTIQSWYCIVHLATDKTFVVSIVLSEGFFYESSPDWLVFAKACENSVVTLHRKLVVDYHCEGDSKRVHVESVSTRVLFDLGIQYKPRDSVGSLCHRANSSHDPAIANVALVDVLWGNIVYVFVRSPEMQAWFFALQICHSHPFYAHGIKFPHFIICCDLTSIFPVQGICSWEIHVYKLLSGWWTIYELNYVVSGVVEPFHCGCASVEMWVRLFGLGGDLRKA